MLPIPSTPKAEFNNYLDRLLTPVDGLGTPIRAIGLENLVKQVIIKAGAYKVKKDLSVTSSCLHGWSIGRRMVPLPIARKMIELYYKDSQAEMWGKIFDSIEYFTSIGSPHRVSLPKFLTPKLSYFVGYLYGDGCLSNAARRRIMNGRLLCEIKIADFSHEQIDNISKLFQELFNVKAPVRDERIFKGQHAYYIDPKCKVVHQFLNCVFEMPTGEKKGKLHFPSVILQAGPELRKWFIAGFFDADGDTPEVEKTAKKGRLRIRIKQASLDILQDIKQILSDDMQITIYGPHRDTNGAWSISSEKRSTVERFCRLIPSIHPIKSWRLKEMLHRLQ